MRRPLLAFASLLAAAPALAAAAGPANFDATATPHTQRDSRPSWRWLSDRIIRSVWRLPVSQAPVHAGSPQPVKGGRMSPSGALLARYGEDMVLRFNISTPYEAEKLAEAANVLFLDVWEFNDNWVDIRLAKDVVPSLLGLLPASLHDAHAPLMRDFELAQAIIDSYPSTDADFPPAREPFSHSLHSSQAQTNIFFRDYQPLSVITPWLRLLDSLFTTHVRLISIGTTFEGRDIPALRVGVHPTDNSNPSGPRKTVLITGGSHAREWISTSTVNYIAYSLITSYGKTGITTALLESFDWVFVPTLNPDGYVYSWETDRLWRKNRQMTSVRFCRGVDLDRSYSFHWDGDATQGNPCSESYSGEEPFQGVEAKAFAEWAKNETENNNVEIVGFLDLHSYSQQVLYPYSYSCYDDPPTLENLEELALGLAKAMRVSHGGHDYQATSACKGNVAYGNKNGKPSEKGYLPRIESGGGSALDWFYHELMIKNSYQIKLRDTGSYGFLLPKENIVPTGNEVLDAVYYLGKYMLGHLGLEVEDDGSTPAEEPKIDVPSMSKPLVSYDETTDDEYADEHIEWELKRRKRR